MLSISFNKELAVVCEWFRNNKMILNPEKCKALVLSRKPNVKLSLFAEGVALPLLDSRSIWANIGQFPEFWKTHYEN